MPNKITYKGLYNKKNYYGRNSILSVLSWSFSYRQLLPPPSKSMDKLEKEGKQNRLQIVDEGGTY
jgi:hypothetical protein